MRDQRCLPLNVERPLQKARAQLVLRQPFIASIALGLELVEDSTCNTGWTDGSRLGFNPTWVAGLRPEQVEFSIAHEAYHVVLAHHLRRGGRAIKRWNLAGDHVINLMLLKTGLKAGFSILADSRYEGLSTEQVYARLPALSKNPGSGEDESSPCGDPRESLESENEPSTDPSSSTDPGSSTDAGSLAGSPGDDANAEGGADGADMDFGEVRDATSPSGAPLTKPERNKLENELKVQVAQVRNQESALRRYGVGSGCTDKAASACLRSEIDWRTALQNFVATVRTRDDYTWRQPNPR